MASSTRFAQGPAIQSEAVGNGKRFCPLEQMNKDCEGPITIRQVKCLKKIVGQDHRAIKRITQPMLSFKSFRAARANLPDIEQMHMIRKRQFTLKREGMSFANRFCALAGQFRLA
jgi:transposase-like protein